MKKYVITILLSIIGIIFFTAYNVEAGEIVNLAANESDFEEISQLKQEIINQINGVRKLEGKSELPEDYNVDISKAYKVYVDTDIFQADTSNANELKELLKQGNYMWGLFVTYNQDTYFIHISKGLPLREEVKPLLTEEQIELIKSQEGQWIAAAVDRLNDNKDYNDLICSAVEGLGYTMKDVDIVICGGLKYIHNPVAIIMHNKQAEYILPLFDLTVEGTEEQKARICALEDDDNNNAVYYYDEIRNAIKLMDLNIKDYDNSSGGSGIILYDSPGENVEAESNNYLGLLILVICAVFLAITIWLKKRLKFINN